jgi:3-oxoacyl-[acyl-carrier-protein] synthase II
MSNAAREIPRVAVTGIGMVTALGGDTESTWSGLVAGRSGVRRLAGSESSLKTSRSGTPDVAAEIDADVMERLVAKLPNEVRQRSARFVHVAIEAATAALDDCGTIDRARVGVFTGVGIGVPHPSQGYAVGPTSIIRMMPNAAAAWISILSGLRGPSLSCNAACASGAAAIGLACDQIRLGRAIAMVAGGVDTVVTADVLRAYSWMRALNSSRDEEPETMSRPFDRSRHGFVLGEGAAFLMLEDMRHARARGARIYAEMRGYGASSEAHSVVAVAPGGLGMASTMQLALADAGAGPGDVQYISAHGTSTKMNDREETAAIHYVFGAQPQLLVSSQKSMLGHTMGAAGAIEAAVTVLSIFRGTVTPTINLHTPDPECDLDYVPHFARKVSIDLALSNSFGFGGHDVCLAFGRVPATAHT